MVEDLFKPIRTAEGQKEVKVQIQNLFGKPNLEVTFCDWASDGDEDRLSGA